MKKVFVLLVVCMCALFGRAQMFITPYIPDGYGMTENNIDLLENRLGSIITQNGMISSEDSRFVLTMNWNVLDKEIIGSAPTVIVYHIEANIALGDGVTGTKYASTTFSMKGAGDNEAKALLNAMKGINGRREDVARVLAVGTQRMMEYFESNRKTILAEVKAMISQGRYDEAVYTLAQIPQEVSYYSEVQSMMGRAYTGYVNQNAAGQLQQARALWAASPSQENAINVMALVVDIDPSSSSYADAQALINDVKNRVTTLDNEDRSEARRIIEHEYGIDTARTQAARNVAVSRARRGSTPQKKATKQKTVNYNKKAVKMWW